MTRRPRRAVPLLRFLLGGLLAVCVALPAGGCAARPTSAPSCQSQQRVALVAQSVPTASFVPCLGDLPPGWSVQSSSVGSGATRFTLLSDRAQGRPVRVRFTSQCRVGGAVPTSSRAPGVGTYIRITSIAPRYSGTLYDEFAGGCVTYNFDFLRGPHIALIQDFESTVRLISRHELRLELHKKLGLDLNP